MPLTAKGNPSNKPQTGRNWRSYIRMEQLARLEATGSYSNIQLAAYFGVTLATIQVMKARPEYQAARIAHATGVLNTISNESLKDVENQTAEIKDMVPLALRTLRDALVRGNAQTASVQERKLAMDASREILDREGQFAKVSRSEIKVSPEVDLERQTQIHDELRDILNAADVARATGDTTKLDEFVKSAGDHAAQDRMKANINLEDFRGGPIN
jgi:hypothetical protein